MPQTGRTISRIIILVKSHLENLPPVMSVATGLAALGVRVVVLVSKCRRETIDRFKLQGITVVLLQEHTPRPEGVLGKISHWRAFRKRAWKVVDETPHDFLWVASASTAMALGGKLLRYRYVMQLHELYDKQLMYRWQLGRYVRGAVAVVVPEVCRAGIIRSWYGLAQTPFVLPNKPESHPRTRNLHVRDEQAQKELAALTANERMVLYQGHLDITRRDVRPVAEAVKELGERWRFVVMGRDHRGHADMLRRTFPGLVYIPHVVAPGHLDITSCAYIGVITYSYECLNHVFCAPNKIWEYAGFGVPMLCNDLPSLQFTVQAAGAGLCVDFQDGERIRLSLQELERNHPLFSQSALQLYESIDVRSVLEDILKDASAHT